MEECGVVLARNALDDESSTRALSAQPGSGHRAIGKCHGRCDSKTEWFVLTDARWALQDIGHVSNIANCEALTAIENYQCGLGAVLFVGGLRVPLSVGRVRRTETLGSAEQEQASAPGGYLGLYFQWCYPPRDCQCALAHTINEQTIAQLRRAVVWADMSWRGECLGATGQRRPRCGYRSLSR